MRIYKSLNKQIFTNGDYSIVPIRMEDSYDIMKWRNEQIYHLRQSEPLTKEKQDWYFENVVEKLFDLEKPNQLLFSFLKNEKCVGYGGLVHINWIDRNAEISFIMDTSIEKDSFHLLWSIYLELIEKVAFIELNFNKVFTYAYDIRPHLFEVLSKNNFREEARLKEHVFFDDEFLDVLIHSKWNREVRLRRIEKEDIDITYKWLNDDLTRKFSFNKGLVPFKNHELWFNEKIKSNNCLYLIAENQNRPIGSFRCDFNEGKAIVSFLLDPKYHGKGFGRKMFKQGVTSV